VFGIALVDDLPFRILCNVSLRPGAGEIIISGPVEESIEEIINHGISFAAELSDLESIPFPDLSSRNLHIRIRLPQYHAPILGPSYGLLLCLELIGTFLGRSTAYSYAVTGEINGDGRVLSVGAIERKRLAASEFGATAIILPGSQLDFFSTSIVQIPVNSIFEAYTAVFYGKT